MDLFTTAFIQIGLITVLGLIVILLVNIRHPKRIFQSTIWQHFYRWQLFVLPFLLALFAGSASTILLGLWIVFFSVKQFASWVNLPSLYLRALNCVGVLTVFVSLFAPEWYCVLPGIYLICNWICALWDRKFGNLLLNQSLLFFGEIWIIWCSCHLFLFASVHHGVHQLIIIGMAVSSANFCAFVTCYLLEDKGQSIRKVFNPRHQKASLFGNLLGAFIGIYILEIVELGETFGEKAAQALLIGVGAFLSKSLLDGVKHTIELQDSVYFSQRPSGILDRMGVYLLPLVLTFHTRYFIGLQ